MDLDGTLIASDTLRECLRLVMRQTPWAFSYLPFCVFEGRAPSKRRVAEPARLEATRLPYREDVLAFLREQRKAGRRLILATAADESIARAVADHLQLFDDVIASDGGANAKGLGKLEAVRAYLHGAKFDYMGDHLVDLPTLRAAPHALLVRPSAALLREARASSHVVRVFTG